MDQLGLWSACLLGLWLFWHSPHPSCVTYLWYQASTHGYLNLQPLTPGSKVNGILALPCSRRRIEGPRDQTAGLLPRQLCASLSQPQRLVWGQDAHVYLENRSQETGHSVSLRPKLCAPGTNGNPEATTQLFPDHLGGWRGLAGVTIRKLPYSYEQLTSWELMLWD